jgi:HD-GYP domain-containing protein (c-di-GMP phosphodiesterase class II)
VVALKDSEISLEARIIAVADVFQALAQERPYRGPLEPQAILANLKQQVEARKLDDRVVALVEANLDECWRTALRQTQV